MSKIEKLIEIAAPPEQVFETFGDAESVRRWLPGVCETRLVEGHRSSWSLNADAGEPPDVVAEIVERTAAERIVWRVSNAAESVLVAGDLIETRAGGSLLRLRLENLASDAAAPQPALASRLLGISTRDNAERALERALNGFRGFVEQPAMGTRQAERLPLVTDVSPPSSSVAPAAATVATSPNADERPNALPTQGATTHAAASYSEVTVVKPSPNSGTAAVATHLPHATRDPVSRPAAMRRSSATPIALATIALLVVLGLAWLWLTRANRSEADAASTSTPDAVEDRAGVSAPSSEVAGSGMSAAPVDSPPVARDEAAGARETNEPKAASENETAALRGSLDEWIAATNDADLDAQMRFYAPTIERYYLRRGFSRAAVREDKAKLMRRARLTNVVAAPPEIIFSSDGRTATMRFRKDYGFEGDAGRDAVMQELRWRKTDDGWRIIAERDLRVLR